MIFSEIRLATGDVDELAAFYGERFGLTVVEHVASHRLSLRIGTSMLSFEQVGSRPVSYHVAFNVPSAQFDETKAWLAARCDLVRDASGAGQFHFDTWNADAVYFYDPAGNLVELIARHTLPDQNDGPFGPHSLMGVSEIGIVTDDVHGTAAQAIASLGEAPYHASLNDNFVPVGDEHGLLIIVANGRPWFPDHAIQGTAAPVEIVIANHPLAQPVQLTPQSRITPL